jgi:hypothetical protein
MHRLIAGLLAFAAVLAVILLVNSLALRSGGAVVLAHPGNNLKGHEDLFGEIMNLGFHGVEAFSSYHTPERAAFYARITREAGRFCTCGSDYHGRMKPAIDMGVMPFPPEYDRAEIEKECRRQLDKYLS